VRDDGIARPDDPDRPDTALAPFNSGRTATHEVGHWFDLLHIWGHDGRACSGLDHVPNQADPNFNKPTFPPHHLQ
jgi:hypothetical protein